MSQHTVKIEAGEKSIKVESPYHPAFVALAKARGGKWKAPHWVFDVRDREAVEAACRSIYGTAGEDVPLVDVRWEMDDDGPEIYALGRMIASRRSRDSAARIGEGVVIVEGRIPDFGGSVKNPRVGAADGTVLEIRDVPLPLALAAVEANPAFAIVGGAPAPAEAGPRAEAIARIRELMAQHGVTAADLAD